MEKARIFLKMVWFNRKNYLLYLLCNSFTIAFLQAFLSIGQNQSFMFSNKIDPMISSNVFAPTVLTILFMILFIPYTYEAFFKSRKQEYAVLMTLGMTEYEIIGTMMAECLMIGVLSFVCASVLGTLLSVFFFFFLRNVIGLSAMGWEFHIDTYTTSGKMYAVVIAIILLLNIIKLIHAQLLDLFKARYKEERKSKGNTAFLIIGLAVILSAAAIMIYNYDLGSTNVWFLSVGIAFIGLSIVFRNFDCTFYKNRNNKWKISLSLVLQYIKSWRLISFISAFLFIVVIFFSAHCAVTFPSFADTALAYSPYDLFYVRSTQVNTMAKSEMTQIFDKYGVSITEEKTLDFLRNESFNILPSNEVNDKFGCEFKVAPGQFIQLFQYDENDGYEHDLQPVKKISVKCRDGSELHLELEGQENKILLNSCRSLADKTLIVNEQDYMKIKENSSEYMCETAVMYQFGDWQTSGTAIRELQESMSKQNSLSEEDQYVYTLSSKIESYETAQQSSEVLAFLLFFVDAMFFAAANISIFYKVKSELNDEKHIALNLYRVGITDKEFWNILTKKNGCYYLIPVLSAILIGVFYSYSVNSVYEYGKAGLICGLIVSCILLLVQVLIIWKVTKYEFCYRFYK